MTSGKPEADFDESLVQRYHCHACDKRFNERTGTPIARLRTPIETVAIAMNVRTEGLGVRATGRSLGKAHSSILRRQHRLAEHSTVVDTLCPSRTRGHPRRR